MRITYLKNKLLMIPIVAFCLILGFDRILTLDFVRVYTENRIEYFFYAMKKDVLKLLKEEYLKEKNKQFLIFFGTSHMGEFSVEEFAKIQKNIIPYNFAAPYSSYSYDNYVLELILKENVQFHYAVLEIFPSSMTLEANRYPLRYSYDFNYFFKYPKHFSYNDWEVFVRSKVFKTAIFPFKVSEIFEKMKNPYKLIMYQSFISGNMSFDFDKTNGGIPNQFLYTIPESGLGYESEKFFKEIYSRIIFDKEQEYFLEKFIQTCIKNNIKIFFYIPIIYKDLLELTSQTEIHKIWTSKLNRLNKKYPLIKTIDMQKKYEKLQCKKFIDSHHMSGGCYDEITKILIENL